MTGAGRLPYRPCVGIVLLNHAGEAWIGRRISKWSGDPWRDMWQMPQGGIDRGETPREAALRELHEETGTDKAEILAESRQWLRYDLPPEALGVALKGNYCGQEQKWFAMRFTGADSDFDIGPRPGGHTPEFDAWRWARLEETVALVAPFKRLVYEALVREFAGLRA